MSSSQLPSQKGGQLVPVTLKEAALDSPTFRGTVQHYSEQVEQIEKWLEGYLKATSRLCEGVKGLEDLVNVFVQKSIPGDFLESVLDYDYTHLAMRRFVEGSREYWGHVGGVAKRLEVNVVEPLAGLQRGELKSFKEVRRQLESSQVKYDSLQSRYASQTKSKDPSSLREDAFQLYEARKIYLKACFDFCVTAPLFRASLDRTITRALVDQWQEQTDLRNRGNQTVDKFNTEMGRIKAWSDSMESCERILKKELIIQRRALEEQVKKETQPARDLDEYSASTVAYLSSKTLPGQISPTEKSEKQGWLFMRSFTSKPTKVIWVRRWFFIRGGIFGYLMQGYRNGQVEESERTGVLLCNVKPAFQEERRFCFEVKTKDTTILLQAETQETLTSWISVFEQAKRTAVNASGSMAAQASSIIPPSAPPPDLMAKEHLGHDENLTMSFDRSLTLPLTGMPGAGGLGSVLGRSAYDSNKSKDSRQERGREPQTPMSAFGALMSATHSQFPSDVRMPNSPTPFSPYGTSSDFNQALLSPSLTKNGLAPVTLADAPAPATLTKSAAVTASSAVPEIAAPGRDSSRQFGQSRHKKTMSLDMILAQERQNLSALSDDDIYPPNYPQALRAQDNQFRVLFPAEDVHWPVLLVFLAAWSLDDRREIAGRCFVTGKGVFFYSHTVGLVCKKELPLSCIEEVSATPAKDSDHIIFHLRPKDPDDSDYEDGKNNTNSLKVVVKTFLEPVWLLQRRLQLLLSNADSEHGLGATAKLLDQLLAMEHEPDGKSTDSERSWEEVNASHAEMHDDSLGKSLAERRIVLAPVTPVKNRHHVAPPVTPRVAPRIVFPSEPVTYVPPGVNKKALEKEFDVSAKALFHVMFGDKSVLFRSLYHQQRARDIYQGPWFRLDNGRMKRDFTYEIENTDLLRRAKRTTVVDYQTIEKTEDYLCYVVTDRKTPWHLPLRDQFMLVSKLVITYVSASKCKLTIWTSVDWSNLPILSKGIIQRQALGDLDTDAQHLGDAIPDQIAKLGTQNRTKNSITIFGQVGEGDHSVDHAAYQSNPSAHPHRQRVTQRSLVHMFVENVASLGESALSTIVMWLISGVKYGYGVVSAQRLLLALLAFSVGSNMLLSTRSTGAYWAERRAARFLSDVGVKPNRMMSRAVYLRDIEDVVRNGTQLAVVPEGQCYSKFRDLASQIDIDANADYAIDSIGYLSPSTRATARNLLRTRQNLGSYRHDLLVAIRMVNSLERTVIRSEWENWLIDEGVKCKQASFMLREKRGRMRNRKSMDVDGVIHGEEYEGGASEYHEDRIYAEMDEGEKEVVGEVALWVKQYCESCEAERRGVWEEGRVLGFV
ncbi:hypothetical protein DFH27DRAFT_516942 [Peziza echinospora]|nr:hypothetical protein DFH27DRAFT_516942 [Peziza echinospora]